MAGEHRTTIKLSEELHRRVQHAGEIGKDREPPGQVRQRGIGSIAGIAVLFAPFLPGLIVIGDDKAGIFQLDRVNRAVGRQRGVIKAGREE